MLELSRTCSQDNHHPQVMIFVHHLGVAPAPGTECGGSKWSKGGKRAPPPPIHYASVIGKKERKKERKKELVRVL